MKSRLTRKESTTPSGVGVTRPALATTRRRFIALAAAAPLAACGGGGGEGDGTAGARGQSRFVAVASMATPRRDPGAVVLNDGRVLVAGGTEASGAALDTAEIYDPALDRWRPTGRLRNTNSNSFLLRLGDGRPVAIGGGNGRAVEVYDTATGTWNSRALAPLPARALSGAMTLLADGRVFVLPGFSATALIYDFSADAWQQVPGLDRRANHAATRLVDGRVLVTGGHDPSSVSNILSSAWLFDPVRLAWRSAGTLRNPRYDHVSALLPDGRILVSHGILSQQRLLDTTELFDPSGEVWSSGGSIHKFSPTTVGARATTLRSGRVLVTGGGTGNDTNILDQVQQGLLDETNVEAFDAATNQWTRPTPGGTGLVVPRRYHACVALSDGGALVVGGLATTVSSSAERFVS